MILKNLKLKLFYLAVVVLLTSCFGGLQPLPDKIEELNLSLSIPVAKAEVGLADTYHIGPPNCFLNLNVPTWAKYEYIYFTDSVAVDLYRIFEHSVEISYMSFNINVWNEFPVKGTLVMDFIDNAGNKLFTFNPFTIEPGDILMNNVVKPGFSKVTAEFDKTKIESIRTAEYLAFNVKINLKDANIYGFQYFDQFTMNCHLGARVDFVLKDVE